jgi:hypothetical protein
MNGCVLGTYIYLQKHNILCFHLKSKAISFLAIEASFSFLEILIVTHSCRTFLIIFHSPSYYNREPMYRVRHKYLYDKKLNSFFSCQNYRANFFNGDKGVFKVFIYNTIINGYGFKLSLLISIRKCNILHWLKIVSTILCRIATKERENTIMVWLIAKITTVMLLKGEKNQLGTTKSKKGMTACVKRWMQA